MIFHGGRSVVRLPQLSLQYLVNRRTALSSFGVERVPALFEVSQSQRLSDLVVIDKLRRPVLHRSYAQRAVSRPKAHTGRTTTAARKAPTTSKTKAAKKPAPRTTTPKAVPKAKSKAKPRIKPKPKPAKKKAKAKPKPKVKKTKKVLTEKENTALTIKRLKITALKPPSGGTVNAWTMFIGERVKAASSPGSRTDVARVAKEASAEYKQLTPERVEHYNHIANQAAIAKATAYRQWIESHTPAVINQANNARRHLRRLGVPVISLQDDRQVKGPRTGYMFFSAQRRRSGDFKGLKAVEVTTLVAREWKALPASEKKHFEDLAAQDMNRYEQEVKTVLNRDVRHIKRDHTAKA